MTKVDRNAPCPCGGGKKYKKCCLTKVDELFQISLEEVRPFGLAQDSDADVRDAARELAEMRLCGDRRTIWEISQDV